MDDFRDEYVGFLRCLGLRTTCLVVVLSAVLFALVVGGLFWILGLIFPSGLLFV